jgi:hypothetical protein
VKWQTGTCWLAVALTLCVPALSADKKDKDKDKDSATKEVDSGSFGVFIKGQRVVTETFRIEQQNGANFIKAQLKESSGASPVAQKSALQVSANGELLSYEWSQTSGGSLTVAPNNDFLIEKISTATSTKPAEQPFLMPSTSAILDNNFFVQREVLVWRYLATNCKSEGGNFKCQSPVEFGALVPQDRTSVRIRLEMVGREKVNLRGSERDLLRINLSGESFDWALWVDPQDQYKLMKVAIPADDTEVIRD